MFSITPQASEDVPLRGGLHVLPDHGHCGGGQAQGHCQLTEQHAGGVQRES